MYTHVTLNKSNCSFSASSSKIKWLASLNHSEETLCSTGLIYMTKKNTTISCLLNEKIFRQIPSLGYAGDAELRELVF